MQLRHRLLQRAAAPQRLLAQTVGYGALGVRALAVRPHQGAHAQQVHDAREAVLPADRRLHDERHGVQALAEGADCGVEVGTGAVQLVDERDPRHAVPVGPPPHRLALRLDAGDRVEDGDGAVEDAQGAFDLVGEVDVARRVDQVEPVAVPVAAHGSGEDGDAAVAFLRVEVGDGGAVVDLAALVGGAGQVEDPFGDGGLARVDVGEDAQVADGGQRIDGAHGPVAFRVIRRVGGAIPGRVGPRAGRGDAPAHGGTGPGRGRAYPAVVPGSAGAGGVSRSSRTSGAGRAAAPGRRRHQDHLMP